MRWNEPATPIDVSNIKPLAEPLHLEKNWLKLVAILTIIGWGLTALTIVGLVVAWTPIWAGGRGPKQFNGRHGLACPKTLCSSSAAFLSLYGHRESPLQA